MGAEVRVPDNETAYLASPAITDILDLDRLAPVDPRNHRSFQNTFALWQSSSAL